MNTALKSMQSDKSLSEKEMIEVMNDIMDGKISEDDIKAFLINLSSRGETTEEITGAAKVMREKSHKIKAPYGAVDCCGTGGDQSGTYNISTAVSLVAAACGIPMAKHGNRASSSKSGTADVLETLGVNLDISKTRLEEALKTLGFGFLMAPHHHPAMKYVAPIRKKLKQRTIFNILGPLVNPAGTRLQLLGVYDRSLLEPMAKTLRKLGSKRAWIVHGADGLDEITTTAETYVAILDDDQITTKILTPEDFGLIRAKPEDLKGGDADENAQALRALLDGHKNAYRDIVLANTAAILVIAEKAETLKHGVEMAAESIDNGLSYDVLRDYIAFSRGSSV